MDYFKVGTFNTGKYGLSWHKKEANTTPIVDGDNVSDAMQKAGMLDIEVGKYPMYIHVGDAAVLSEQKQLVMTNVPWSANGIQVMDRSVSWYEPVQNRQYAEVLDGLTSHYPVAGVLMCGKYGEVMAVQLELPEYTIGGQDEELHKPFLMIAEDRKSGMKQWGSVHTRIVCANTYAAATAEKGDKSLPNCGDSYAILKFRSRIEEKAIKSHQDYIAGLNHLFKTPVQSGDVNNLIAQLFPEPQKPQMVKLWENNQDVLNGDSISETVDKRGQRANQLFQNAIERNERYSRELAQNFFQFNDEFAYAANSRYSLWQATTQFFNHSQEWQSDQDVHAYNVLFGDKAKQMNLAWAILTK